MTFRVETSIAPYPSSQGFKDPIIQKAAERGQMDRTAIEYMPKHIKKNTDNSIISQARHDDAAHLLQERIHHPVQEGCPLRNQRLHLYVFANKFRDLDFHLKHCPTANIGGLLGLCLGFSLLTVVEIIYWFCIRWSILKLKRHNEKAGDADESRANVEANIKETQSQEGGPPAKPIKIKKPKSKKVKPAKE